ncbi:MAG: protein kinase [Myxococcales bacterium]|nr:protein kinase [Myxococcales bacterium]
MRNCPLCRIVLRDEEPVCPRDGREPVSLELEPLPPDLAERFRIVEPFARGDTGSLYVVDETSTGRRGLLKLLHGKGAVADRQRLKRELAKQATLSNDVLAFPFVSGESSGGMVWLLREWVDGISLRVRLSRGGPLSIQECLHVTAELATALDELHRSGLLHRDLKPGHVILSPQPSGLPRVRVVDAGIVARIEQAGGPVDLAGTPDYVSPEQVAGKLVSFRSDLYALGCMLFEMATGRAPFARGSVEETLRAHAEAPLPTMPPALPAGVQALLVQLLARDPRERPFSAQQVRRVVEPFLGGGRTSREPTVGFEAGADAAIAAPTPTGTLRPPGRPKATLLGLPAVQPDVQSPARPTSRPPPPPDVAGVASIAKPPTSMPSRPPPPPELGRPTPSAGAPTTGANGKKPAASADGTQELDALDEVLVPDEAVEPARSDARHQRPASVPRTDAGSQPVTGMSATTPSDGLDYDELAETTALARDEARVLKEGLPPVAEFESGAADVAPRPLGPSDAVRSSPPDSGEMASGAATFGSAGMGMAEAAPAPALAPKASDSSFARSPSHPSIVQGSDELPDASRRSRRARAPLSWLVLGGMLGFCVASAVAGLAVWWWWRTRAPVALFESVNSGRPGAAERAPAPVVPPSPPVAAPTSAAPTARVPVAAPSPPTAPQVASAQPGSEQSPTHAPLSPTKVSAGMPPRAGSDLTPSQTGSSAERGSEPERTSEGPGVAATSSSVERTDRGTSERRRPRREETETGRRSAREPTEPTRGTSGGAETSGDSRARAFDELRAEARRAFQEGRYAAAEAAYERATAMQPTHAGVWAGLGAARLQSGNARGAVQAYQRAVDLQPTNAAFFAALGEAYERAGDRGRARQAYERALTLDPSNARARAALARL